MKAQRRHELQENVLKSQLRRSVDFVKGHSNLFAWGLLVVAIAVLAWVLYDRSVASKNAEYARQYLKLCVFEDQDMTPDALRSAREELFKNDSDPQRRCGVAWMLAISYAQEAMLGKEKEQNNRKATEWYKKIIDEFSKQRLIVAKAHLGLGKLAESAGDLEKAREEYQFVVNMTDLKGCPVLDVAGADMESLVQLRQPVPMATTAPSTQPATSTAPSTGPTSQPTSYPMTAPFHWSDSRPTSGPTTHMAPVPAELDPTVQRR